MKRLLLLMIVFFGGIVQVVAENTLFYDSKQLTCDLITSICQDKDGFIWIGTDYGLNKFNGIQFTHYYNNPKDSTSLSDNSVKALMLDNEGTLWVGGIGGLQYYVPEENAFRTIKFEESSSFHIMCITQLRSGEIWVGSSGRGIFRIRKDTGTGEQMTDIPDVSEHAHYGVIYEDRHGSIWIGVNGTGLLRYDPSTRTSKIYTRAVLDGGSTISGMAEDHSGNFLLSTGLQRPEAQGVLTPAGHDLHRHTALKDLPIFEAVDLRLLGGGQLLPEGQILLLGQGAVDVVRSPLIIAGGEVGTVHIHTVKAHQRSGSVEEVQGGLLSVSQQSRQTIRQSVGGQRPGGHHHLPLRQLRYLAGDHGDEGVVPELLRHHPGKALPVHCQSASGGDGGGVGAAEDQAVQAPQLLLQQAHGIFIA